MKVEFTVKGDHIVIASMVKAGGRYVRTETSLLPLGDDTPVMAIVRLVGDVIQVNDMPRDLVQKTTQGSS